MGNAGAGSQRGWRIGQRFTPVTPGRPVPGISNTKLCAVKSAGVNIFFLP